MITAFIAAAAIGQLPGLGNKLPGIPGLDAIFKKGPAITTSLKDCKWEANDRDTFNPTCDDLFKLERGANHGFILKTGAWESLQQSY
jgi:hypothetical protein